MKIRKARIVSPDRNMPYGIVALAISFFVFAYSTRFGQAPILVYYALWLPLLAIDPQRYLSGFGHLSWTMAFAAFALLSVFWSAEPATTARAAVQYATHLACALIAARSIGIRTFCLGGLAGVVLVLLYSLAAGRYLYDPIDGAYTFAGAFSSKNQLGFFASLGIFFSVAIAVVLRERRIVTLLALAAGALSAWCLLMSQSATSMITVIVAVAALLGARLLQTLAPAPRGLLAIGGGIGVIVVAIAAVNMGAFDAILGAFGKDATLTGRTYLWSQGIAAAGDHPVAGLGYYAYWVQGRPDAERLWDEFYITARTGFHFHNTYIETAVELGGIGLALLVVMLAGALGRHLLRLFGGGDMRDAQILFGLTAMLLMRSFVEVDVITPYVVGSFLLCYAAEYRTLKRTRPAVAEGVPVLR